MPRILESRTKYNPEFIYCYQWDDEIRKWNVKDAPTLPKMPDGEKEWNFFQAGKRWRICRAVNLWKGGI